MGSNLGPYGRPWPTLHQLLQADQEVGPLCAAVMHKFHFCSPSTVLEQQHRLPVLLADIEVDACINPLLWAGHALPAHSRWWGQLQHLKIGPSLTKTKL